MYLCFWNQAAYGTNILIFQMRRYVGDGFHSRFVTAKRLENLLKVRDYFSEQAQSPT